MTPQVGISRKLSHSFARSVLQEGAFHLQDRPRQGRLGGLLGAGGAGPRKRVPVWSHSESLELDTFRQSGQSSFSARRGACEGAVAVAVHVTHRCPNDTISYDRSRARLGVIHPSKALSLT